MKVTDKTSHFSLIWGGGYRNKSLSKSLGAAVFLSFGSSGGPLGPLGLLDEQKRSRWRLRIQNSENVPFWVYPPVEYYGKDLSTISQAFRADIKIDCSGTFFRATPFLDGPGSVLSRRIWQKQLGLHLGWEPINTNSTATFDQGQQFLETLFMFGAQEICEHLWRHSELLS